MSNLKSLFSRIEAGKSRTENRNIIYKITSIIKNKYIQFLSNKNERRKQKEIFFTYKIHLTNFKYLIDKQLNELNKIDNTDFDEDSSVRFIKLSEQISNLCIKQLIFQYINMSHAVEKNEKESLSFIHLYSIFDKHKKIISEELDEIQCVDSYNYEILTQTINKFENALYLYITIDNNSKFNKKIISNFYQRNSEVEYSKKQLSSLYLSDFQRQLSETIYERRKRNNITQKELSTISGVDRTMIAKIENIQQPTSINTAIKLLTALDMGITLFSLK